MAHGGHGGGGNDEAALMAALSGIPIEQALLMQRAQRAQGMASAPMPQGQQMGRVYRASSPLEALASAMTRYRGAKDMRGIEGEYAGLAGRAQEASMAQLRAERAPAPTEWNLPPGLTRTEGVRLLRAPEPPKPTDPDNELAPPEWKALPGMTRGQAISSGYAKKLDPRPAGGGGGHGAFLPAEDTKAIAEAIARGELPPNLTPFRSNASAIAAELARKGTNVAEQQLNFGAEQKAISSLNSAQQVRLRQTMDTLDHSLGKLEEVYGRWQKLGPASGFRKFNRAALVAAQQVGGETGATAQELTTLINDLTAEVANVYMGGNSPTDHALKLAGENLKADWNDETFAKLLKLMKTQLGFRRQAMEGIRAAGTRGENQYAPPATPGAGDAKGNDPLGIR
jgi:hypothetical protein